MSMEAEGKHASILPLSMLILAFGLGGIYLYDQPYSIVRPSDATAPIYSRSAIENVDARLWEDPFEAVARADSTSPCTDWNFVDASVTANASASIEPAEAQDPLEFLSFQATASRQLIQLAYEVRRRSEPTRSDIERALVPPRVVLMPVLVPGEPYFEQSETRRRLRYAVLSGLANRGYVPESSAHIGVIDVCWDSSGRLDPGTGRPTPLPYEWLIRDSVRPAVPGGPAAVLVLWLNESELIGDPWGRLLDLLGHLIGYRLPTEDAPSLSVGDELPGRYSFRLIGPANSDILGNMTSATRATSVEPEMSPPAAGGQVPSGGGEEAANLPHIDLGSSSAYTSFLVFVTTMYLDDPTQMFGENAERTDQLQVAWSTVVADVMKNLAADPRDAGYELVEPIAAALEQAGSHVRDSDPFWYETVARLWLDTVNENRPEKRHPLDDLAESLCRELAPDESCTLEPESSTVALAGSNCNSVTTLVSRLRCHLGWTSPKFKARFSLTEWTGELAQDLRRLALTDEERLSIAPAAVPGRVNRWIIANQPELVGSLNPAGDVLSSLFIYNNRATAPASLLLGGFVRKGDVGYWRSLVQQELVRAAHNLPEDAPVDLDRGPHFVPVIHHDDELVPLLVEELERRGLDICSESGKDHLALIGEWDTLYGRALPLTVEAELVRCREETSRQQWTEDTGHPPEASPIFASIDDAIVALMRGQVARPDRVSQFQYLRGLDGVAASAAKTESADGGGSNRGVEASEGGSGSSFSRWLPWGSAHLLERARGNRQFDYMRRLADQLSLYGEELRDGGGELRAIGVVGTDAYDKLLVLQALRTRFPRTLFFTTDLDARMVHPADHRWNRNMIIASSFDLRLHPDLQGNIPPFRDSYQTATFLAVRAAMDAELLEAPAMAPEIEPDGMSEDRVREASYARHWMAARRAAIERASLAIPIDGKVEAFESPGPRLFEVGRNGPYQITVEPEPSDGRRLHPPRRTSRPTRATLVQIALVSGVGFCLLIPMMPNLRRFTLDRWQATDPRDRFAVNLFTGLVLITLVAYGWMIYQVTGDSAAEPFEMLEGISIWPTEAVRLATTLLSLFFIGLGHAKLRRDEDALSRVYGLPAGRRADWAGCWRRWREARWQDRRDRARRWLRGFGAAEPRGFWTLLRHALSWPRSTRADWWRARLDVSINAWRCATGGFGQIPGGGEPADGRTVDGGDVWDRYRYLGRWEHRATRFVPITLLYFLLGYLLIQLFGEPHVPHRGALSLIADRVILYSCVLLSVALTFFVVDATRLCERFIEALAERPTEWPEGVVDGVVERRHIDRRDVGDVIDLELIADRTEVVGSLILYPFVVLFLMIVSRASFFDNWDWPVGLLLILGMSSAYALACAVVLRRAAEKARQKTIEHLRANLYEAIGDGETARAEQIRLLIDEAREMHRGAFSHWTRHPVVKAVLLPFSGVGVLALIELLAVVGR